MMGGGGGQKFRDDAMALLREVAPRAAVCVRHVYLRASMLLRVERQYSISTVASVDLLLHTQARIAAGRGAAGSVDDSLCEDDN